MTATQHTPRYHWSSPQDWLGDRINALITTVRAERLSLTQDVALADLSIIANTIVNGTLAVDSDAVQDAFQDDMESAGYFRDLDLKVPVLYEMEPIGVGGALEAGVVHWFCSDKCRRAFEIEEPVEAGENGDFEDGTQCEECGKEVSA